MKKINKEECIKQLKKAINDRSIETPSISIYKINEKNLKKSNHFEYRLEISTMYSYIDFGFDFLEAVSKIFNTKQINFQHGTAMSGCETCDYGSRYTMELYIKKSDVEIVFDKGK